MDKYLCQCCKLQCYFLLRQKLVDRLPFLGLYVGCNVYMASYMYSSTYKHSMFFWYELFTVNTTVDILQCCLCTCLFLIDDVQLTACADHPTVG